MNTIDNSVTQGNDTSASSFQISRKYGVYILILLWFAGLLRFMDIQIFAVVLPSVEKDFHLSDTQAGILSGFAFAIFYATLGIPLAYMADRFNRRNILSIVLTIWSGMTALCGVTVGYVSLFLARMGVGIGEAGAMPTINSLLADYFPPSKRGTVFAIFNTSIPIGVFCGFIVGGWVLEHYGWRATFYSYGIPGVIVAILIRLTFREPPRGFLEGHTTSQEPVGFSDTLKFLWQRRSYRHLVMATTIMTAGAYGSGIWIPTFFTRIHGMSMVKVTEWLAFIYGGGGLVGSMLGGWLSDRLTNKNNDARWYMRIPAMAALMIMPFSFFVYLWPNPYTALKVQLCTTVLMHMYLGPAYGTVQSLAGAKRRAMAAGINLLAVNFLGYTLGPFLVGYANDYLHGIYGEHAIRYSMLGLVLIAYTWAAIHFFLASRNLREDIASANEDS